MSSPASPRFSFWRDLRDHAPIWFVALMAFALLNYEVTNIDRVRYAEIGLPLWKFALTATFPLFWVLLYNFFRARDTQRLRHPWVVWGVLAAMMIGGPLAIFLFGRPRPLTNAQIVLYYEAAQFVWLALMVAQCWYTRGLADTVLFFGVGFLYGLTLENTGIIMGYFGESQYKLYLPFPLGFYLPAPLATQVGWCIMFYVSISLAEFFGGKIAWLGSRPWRMAVFTSLLAVTLDLQIDPLASLSGLWWKWDPRLPGWWLGVPLLNFVAWFSAFLPFSYLYYRYRTAQHLTPWLRVRRMMLWVPWLAPACMLIGTPFIALYEGGFHGPAFQIAREFLAKLMPY